MRSIIKIHDDVTWQLGRLLSQKSNRPRGDSTKIQWTSGLQIYTNWQNKKSLTLSLLLPGWYWLTMDKSSQESMCTRQPTNKDRNTNTTDVNTWANATALPGHCKNLSYPRVPQQPIPNSKFLALVIKAVVKAKQGVCGRISWPKQLFLVLQIIAIIVVTLSFE